jgi:hypothetical protein
VSSFAAIEAELDAFTPHAAPEAAAHRLVALAEEVLEHWIEARGEIPTRDEKEGFRFLALHKQGARGVPSFNACRETCREIAYHCNLLHADSGSALASRHQRMMALLVKHLLLFVSGKMQVEGLGEFCCASRPLRLELTQPS